MASKPTIAIFYLGHPSESEAHESGNKRLLNTLAGKAVVIRANSPKHALDILRGKSTPARIFVADSGLSEPTNRPVLDSLVNYTKHGGTVLVGGIFSTTAQWDKFGPMFAAWGLPWAVTSYTKQTIVLNRASAGTPNATLPAEYYLKATFLKNVDDVARWYKTKVYFDSDDEEDEEMRAAVLRPNPLTPTETAVAFAKVGDGWLGYLGDVNCQAETDAITLAMLDLM
ncbi:hypothetical protein H2200_012492 [Cladophialophora chaetospira]|uniref:Uncharacterized protein n=1 Tax=Cladophialophora chaetospira TaxID=386627 RepID=A0AA38WY15_9EURO|nr:hypothetical protein H2200_012492 [Cladophialophora chaetospira]